MSIKYNNIIKKITVVCALSVCVLSLLSGCKKDKNKPVENETQNVQENAVTGTEASDNMQDTDEEKNEASKKEDLMKIYERFLNDEEPLYFDVFDLDKALIFTSEGNYFPKNTPYTLSEFVTHFAKVYTEYYGFVVEPESIEYAFIDCGLDGIPELTMRFNDVTYFDDLYVCDFIIKEMNGKLEVCYAHEAGYRSFAFIYESGLCESGGSASAAGGVDSFEYIDADGKYIFDYSVETSFGANFFYVPDNDTFYNAAEQESIGEYICIMQYSFEPYDVSVDYADYLSKCTHTYYALDEYYDVIEDDMSIYQSGNPYRRLWGATGYDFITPDEVDKVLDNHEKELGITKEIRNSKVPEYTALTKAQIDNIYKDYESAGVKGASTKNEPPYVTIKNPSWDYYCSSPLEGQQKYHNLTLISKQENDITDIENWYDRIGWFSVPNWNYCDDDTYSYYLHGGEGNYYPSIMDICDVNTGEIVATLDFAELYYPERYYVDSMFVTEAIKYAKYIDGILYVSTCHNTYASSCPENAYIMAIDTTKEDYPIIWKSQPLVCNSNNFEIIDDTIFCGYGFTAEDDYIYYIDRTNGQVKDKILVRTAPDYFYYKDGTLYVRTYNMDYDFKVN